MLDGLTLDQMRVFMTVAATGSFRAAAARLNRAQSAVSHAISGLEAQLGLKLFQREGLHRPELTPDGQILLSDVCAVLRRVDALKAKARGLGEAVEMHLAIAVDPLFPDERLAGALKTLQERYPLIGVRVLSGALGVPIHALRQRLASLAVTFNADVPDPRFQFEALGTVRMMAVAAPSHPLGEYSDQLTGTAVMDHVQIVVTDASPETAGEDYGVFSPMTWRVSDIVLKRALILAGAGWGSLPEHLIAGDLAAGRLVRLALPEFGPGSGLVDLAGYVAWPADAALGPAARFLANALVGAPELVE